MILDTDTLSALVARTQPPRLWPKIAAFTGRLFTTSVNWAEICYGLARHPAGERLRRRYQDAIIPSLQFLEFDSESAEIYGKVRAELEQRGERLPDADLMVASIALRHGMTLITGNTGHFARIPGLRVENWLEE